MDKKSMKFSKKWYRKLRRAKHLQGVVVKQEIETGRVLMEFSRKQNKGWNLVKY